MSEFHAKNLQQLSLMDTNEEYKAFVDKFKPKLTTDDCLTPEPVYEAVAGYVEKRYGIDRKRFVRPFYPGGGITSGMIIQKAAAWWIIHLFRSFQR